MSNTREKSFARRITALDAVFAFIDEYVTEFIVAPEVAYTLQFAIEEIFTNLVKYDSEAASDITIRLSKDDSRITAVVINAGGSDFDMTAFARADDRADPLEDGRLGIFLVRKMVNEFRYEYSNGTGIITVGTSLEG